MNPNYWGPAAWHFLHCITLSYPERPTEEDKKKFFVFFNLLQETLPCPACRKHYKQNLEKLPIRLDSKEDLFRWFVDFHNEVNRKKGKKTLNYNEAFQEIKKNGEKINEFKNSTFVPEKECDNRLTYVLIGIIVLLLLERFWPNIKSLISK